MLQVLLGSLTPLVQPLRMFLDKHTLLVKRYHTKVISGRYAIGTSGSSGDHPLKSTQAAYWTNAVPSSGSSSGWGASTSIHRLS